MRYGRTVEVRMLVGGGEEAREGGGWLASVFGLLRSEIQPTHPWDRRGPGTTWQRILGGGGEGVVVRRGTRVAVATPPGSPLPAEYLSRVPASVVQGPMAEPVSVGWPTVAVCP